MAENSITLTASMRSNLSSLKNIQGQMDKTQEKLSTGKKVNSAIDNASSFYQSRALNNRASDLDSLLDSMAQGIQTIQAANEGLEAITNYVEQAKSIANSAYALDQNAADYTNQVKNYQEQYNQILDEIETLAKDASYQGVNLLKEGNLTVMFNESRTHSLAIKGDDVVQQMENRGFKDAAWVDETAYDTASDDLKAKNTALEGKKTALDAAESALKLKVSSISSEDAYQAAVTSGVATKELYIKKDDGSFEKAATGAYKEGTTYFTMDDSDKLGAHTTAVTAYNTAKADVESAEAALKNVSAASAKAIDTDLGHITKATDYLRSYATELGNNFAIIETRQNFTEALVDVLETGADNLVLADMNEESANYLALQTRQQLAVNSLSLASQSAQAVLKLF